MVKRLTQKLGTKGKDKKANVPCVGNRQRENEGLTFETAELKKKFTPLKNSLCSFSFPIFHDCAWTPFVSHQDRSLPKKHPIKENHANE